MVLLAIAILCGLVFSPSPTQATLITIGIEAVVDDVVETGDYLNGRIKVGDLITGTYTYDTDTPDSSSSPNVGRYEHYTYPSGISLSVGGFDFMTDPATTNFLIEIVNDFPDDAYSVISYRNLALSDGTSVGHISWGLRDYSATAISIADLAPTAPVLDDWGGNRLEFGAGSGGRDTGEPATGFGVMAHVTSAVVIPEPATILLLGLGGIAVIRKVRK